MGLLDTAGELRSGGGQPAPLASERDSSRIRPGRGAGATGSRAVRTAQTPSQVWCWTRRATCMVRPALAEIRRTALVAAERYSRWIRPARRACSTASLGRTGRYQRQVWCWTHRATYMEPPPGAELPASE